VKSFLAHAVRPVLPGRATGWIGLLLLGLAASLHAADLPAPVTLDVPIPPNRALPAWLGQPSVPATSFATLDLPILTPDPAATLLVTVYFREKQGGFLRITWNGTQGAQTLSDNFYEDIGMANQRSLLVPAATLVGDGTLRFQSSDASIGIRRIKLEWLENKDGLVSSEIGDQLVTTSSGLTAPALTLNGQPSASAPGAWENLVVTVPMTDTPVRIEQGVDFSIDLDEVPATARIALEETGLALGQHLIVWINEMRAGTMTPDVPELADGGYLADANSATNYVGWREASFYAPVSLLKAGMNTVQFSTEADSPSATFAAAPDSGTDAPLAIKAFVMQLNYTPAPSSAIALFPAAASQPSSDPQPQFLSPTGPDLRPVSPDAIPETTTP
jgi:hypothetical protein